MKYTTSCDHCRMSSAWATASGVPPRTPSGLVADLVAVAVRAVQQVAAPPFGDAGDVGDLVAQAGGDQDSTGARTRPSASVTSNRGPSAGGVSRGEVGDGAGDELAAVAGDLGSSLREQGGGRGAVPAEEAVHVRCWCVARLAGVDDGDPAAGAGEDQGC